MASALQLVQHEVETMLSEVLNISKRYVNLLEGSDTYMIDSLDRSTVFATRPMDKSLLLCLEELNIEALGLKRKHGFTKIPCKRGHTVFITRLKSGYYMAVCLNNKLKKKSLSNQSILRQLNLHLGNTQPSTEAELS